MNEVSTEMKAGKATALDGCIAGCLKFDGMSMIEWLVKICFATGEVYQ